MKRVTDVIPYEEAEQWQPGDIITISAGTGSGKSYFIKNTLYELARKKGKKILMLIHRRTCVDQFQLEVKKDGKLNVIDVRTFQSFEKLWEGFGMDGLWKFDYIVSDEFHYFLSDASFNYRTDISLKLILKQTKAVRIFMSATGEEVKRYLTSQGIQFKRYQIKPDFSHIKRVEFYTSDDALESYAEEAIRLNKKAIFFIESAKKAANLYKKFKEHAMFVCSSNSWQQYKLVNKEKVKEMLAKERFEEQVLITTRALEAGVNIIDPDLKHIVCDIKDFGTLLQCVGRKRIQGKDDTLVLHVKVHQDYALKRWIKRHDEIIKRGDFFNKHGEEAYVRKNYRNIKGDLIYDEPIKGGSHKVLNDLMYYQSKTTRDFLTDLLKDYGKQAYRHHVAEMFGKEYSECRVYMNKSELERLDEYLDSMVGKDMLQTKDREELILKLDVRHGIKNQPLRKVETLNEFLREKQLDYYIYQYSTSRIINGEKKNFKSAWKVRRLTDE